MPGVVALMMAYIDDPVELRDFIRQLRVPKCSWFMYVFAIFAPIAICLLMLIVENVSVSIFTHLRLRDFLRLFLINLWFAPLWEEIGWRGYLLPILRKRIGLGRASLFLGLIWGIWHFVLYYVVFGVSFSSFALSFLAIAAASVTLAVLYSASNDSLILPILFHTAWNGAVNWLVIAGFHYTLYSNLLLAVGSWAVAAALWYRLRPDARIESKAVA